MKMTVQKAKSSKEEKFLESLESIFEDSNKNNLSNSMFSFKVLATPPIGVKEGKVNFLNSSIEELQEVEMKIKNFLNKEIKTFLLSNKGIIKRAYKLNDSGPILHYSIILKDDDLNKRSKLYSFISNYRNSTISNRFPVVFQNIPLSLEDAFENESSLKDKYEIIL